MEITHMPSARRATLGFRWPVVRRPALVLAFLIISLWNLSYPTLWWDEGWTLSVARNWVERGHYGRLLNGELAPPGLEASFPVTASVALSFQLFGVGIWQGRLVIVLFTLAALAVTYDLARRLYNRPIAKATLVVLLLMSAHPQTHPFLLGRRVMAEMPMLVFLLAGYSLCLAGLRRSAWLTLGAAGIWGCALIVKAQVLPFWTVSLVVPLLAALMMRQWKAAGLFGTCLLVSPAISQGLIWLQSLVLQGQTLSATSITGLYEVTAFVPQSLNRIFALKMVLLTGLPALLGLVYAAWRWIGRLRKGIEDPKLELVRLSVLALAGCWFGWFLLLSVGVPRYLFPATYVASIFLALLLHDLTGGFRRLPAMLGAAGYMLRSLRVTRQGASAMMVLAVFTLTVPLTLLTLNRYYLHDVDRSALDAARFLDTETPPGALVESYESELHFLAHRRFHYPPDQLHVELNRRSMLHQDVRINYDPLAANPDYLVVGEFTRTNGLYAPVLKSGVFRPLRTFGMYEIYERVR
jgi:hypothetical protein